MKYETFDQPAYGVGDLETFGITDNSGSLIMDFSQNSGMESWRADSLLSEELQAYTQVSRAHEMGGDGGTIPPPPPPPPGSDDDDTSTDDSSSDTSGNGDIGSGDDDEETTYLYEQVNNPYSPGIEELGCRNPEAAGALAGEDFINETSSNIDPNEVFDDLYLGEIQQYSEHENEYSETVYDWNNLGEETYSFQRFSSDLDYKPSTEKIIFYSDYYNQFREQTTDGNIVRTPLPSDEEFEIEANISIISKQEDGSLVKDVVSLYIDETNENNDDYLAYEKEVPMNDFVAAYADVSFTNQIKKTVEYNLFIGRCDE